MTTYETINDLIAALEEARDEFGGDAPVRVAMQPHWPLAARVLAVGVVPAAAYDADLDDGKYEHDEALTCWVAVDQVGSGEHPYAPAWAFGEYAQSG